MLEPSVRLFIYQSVCFENYPNDTTCIKLHEYPARENHVQHISSTYIMIYKILINLPAVFLGLFCGAWSDKIGRKLPVMLPCVGTIFAVLFYMMGMLNNVPSLPFVLIGAIIRGAFGKSAIVTMALHSYITDLSTKEERTLRLSRLLAMNFFGFFAGSLIAGGLLEVASFDVVFLTVVFINSLCVLVSMLLMKESLPDPNLIDPMHEDPAHKKTKNPFKVHHIKESLDVVAKSRKANTRFHILILFFTIILNQVCKSGEVDTTLLYVERSPLSWTKSMYDYLLALDYAFLGISVFFILPVLSSYYGVHDLTLVCIGLLFRVIRLLILAFSNTTWMVYFSVMIGCPSAFAISGTKSLISKMVGEHEIGKVFSLLSCGETISNLLGTVIFNTVYTATLSIYPGLTFSMDSMAFFIWLVVILLMSNDIKESSNYRLLEELNEANNYGTADQMDTKSSKEFLNGIVEQKEEPLDTGGGDYSKHVDPQTGLTKQTIRLDFRKRPADPIDLKTPQN